MDKTTSAKKVTAFSFHVSSVEANMSHSECWSFDNSDIEKIIEKLNNLLRYKVDPKTLIQIGKSRTVFIVL